jgi:hypothetical protein
MRMRESRFGAPADIYFGKFLGISPFKGDGKPRIGRDGKPMGEAVEWQWEIIEGEHAGKIVGRLTSTMPTTKNAAGTLLAGVAGRVVQVDEDIDPNAFVGCMYQIVVSVSKDNPNKTYVTQVMRSKRADSGPPPSVLHGNGNAVPPPRPAPAPVSTPAPTSTPAAAPAPTHATDESLDHIPF